MPKVTLFILGHLQTIILDQSLPKALEQTMMESHFQKHEIEGEWGQVTAGCGL